MQYISISEQDIPNVLSRLRLLNVSQVYVAAGTVFGLEAELGDLEACARGISGATSDQELSFLEDQMASAAAQVQQSDLQVCSAWMPRLRYLL